MAPPLLRHQSSLQGFLDFSSTSVLTPDQFNQATAIFDQIVSRYEPSQAERPSPTYKHITLLRTVHESVISKDIFLNHFFLFVDADLQRDPDASTPTFSDILTRFDNLHSWSLEQLNEFQGTLVNFSDYLVNNFFLPRIEDKIVACVCGLETLTLLQSKHLATRPLNLPLLSVYRKPLTMSLAPETELHVYDRNALLATAIDVSSLASSIPSKQEHAGTETVTMPKMMTGLCLKGKCPNTSKSHTYFLTLSHQPRATEEINN